jgi:regulator of sigma E protease
VVKADDPSWAHGLAPGEKVVRAAGRNFDSREEFREFVDEAVRKGAGVVRLDMEGEGEEGTRRRIALAIRPNETSPKLAIILPLLKGVTGQTEYRLSLLPIGGYVKMAGDIPGETTGSSDEFLGKSPGARGIIFAAGSVMNAVFGLCCFILSYQVGVQSASPEVGGVIQGMPAQKAGLLRGDRIVEVNGRAIHEFLDVPQEVAYAVPGDGLRFVVERDGNRVTLPPEGEAPVKNYYHPKEKRQVAGIIPIFTTRVDRMTTESPLYRAGLRPKDRIAELAGKATDRPRDIEQALLGFLGSGSKSFEMVVERDGKRLAPMNVELDPDTKKHWRLGVTPEWELLLAAAPAEGPAKGVLFEGDRIRVTQSTGSYLRKGIPGALRSLKDVDFPLTVPFHVERRGETKDLEVEVKNAEELEALAASIDYRASFVISAISKRSHLGKGGIPVGAKIVGLAGRPFSSQEDVFGRLDTAGASPIEVEWTAPESGDVQSSSVELVSSFELDMAGLGLQGFREKREYLRLPFFTSISMGAKKSLKFAFDVFRTLRGIFITRSLGGQSIGGPVTIAVASYKFAEYGIGKLLFFLGLLSINLAIINLLPIPILDGGHLLFLFIEKVKGSPVSETGQAFAQWAGLLILLSLMVYVTWNDIWRLAAR